MRTGHLAERAPRIVDAHDGGTLGRATLRHDERARSAPRDLGEETMPVESLTAYRDERRAAHDRARVGEHADRRSSAAHDATARRRRDLLGRERRAVLRDGGRHSGSRSFRRAPPLERSPRLFAIVEVPRHVADDLVSLVALAGD